MNQLKPKFSQVFMMFRFPITRRMKCVFLVVQRLQYRLRTTQYITHKQMMTQKKKNQFYSYTLFESCIICEISMKFLNQNSSQKSSRLELLRMFILFNLFIFCYCCLQKATFSQSEIVDIMHLNHSPFVCVCVNAHHYFSSVTSLDAIPHSNV